MTPDAAEALAAEALAWMAGDQDLIGSFLAASGAAPGDLASVASEPAFLGFVLDFLLGDDETVTAFAQATNRSPESVIRARAALPGGMTPEWT
ncbi:MAG: DUF3572 domain-containing protein [Pseudomonadota bacterium]